MAGLGFGCGSAAAGARCRPGGPVKRRPPAIASAGSRWLPAACAHPVPGRALMRVLAQSPLAAGARAAGVHSGTGVPLRAFIVLEKSLMTSNVESVSKTPYRPFELPPSSAGAFWPCAWRAGLAKCQLKAFSQRPSEAFRS